MSGTFTGRHMAALTVGFFAVVIAVNVTMAYFATSTFGGTVVINSYVASQRFNGWLAKARAERALGWTVSVRRGADSRLEIATGGGIERLEGATARAVVRHPLGRAPEQNLVFSALGDGRFRSTDRVPPGRWIVHVTVAQGGRTVNGIVDLQ